MARNFWKCFGDGRGGCPEEDTVADADTVAGTEEAAPSSSFSSTFVTSMPSNPRSSAMSSRVGVFP